MGIPSFYKWLSERYPLCTAEVVEEVPVCINGVTLPVDASRPNPNGFEFDNLYLDMNGIIHPCFHPEGLLGPTTNDGVFEGMFRYIDRIFSFVRPRKLLFLAIDGVAPRAKMNHQRARRFKAAIESSSDTKRSAFSESKEQESLSLEQPLELNSESKPPENDTRREQSPALEHSCQMDSNVITPGTEFMEELSSALQYYINMRINDDLAWRGIKVIFSDVSVPGEGEHKIMSYIRLQRNLPGYDPNTRHCLYGLDADLVMLALASHEIHFSILREDTRNNKVARKTARKLTRHKRENCVDKIQAASGLEDYIMLVKFEFLNIWVLREYLAMDMRIQHPSLEIDTERLVDDFVLMCLFVGNDFLPNLPGMEISEGAINLLLMIYKDEFIRRGGYLTDSYKVNLKRVEHLLQSAGAHEYKVMKKRGKNKNRLMRSRDHLGDKHVTESSKSPCHELNVQSKLGKSSLKPNQAPVSQDLENLGCRDIRSSSIDSAFGKTNSVTGKTIPGVCSKQRYYSEKFGAQSHSDLVRIQKHAVYKYVEGVCWVMRYYYDGVCSWQWFYPYHYAPFASDFCGTDQIGIEFTLGEPFKPLDQLMAVLPTASAHALPPAYRKLMTDATSPILDFYPTEFEVDVEGKRFEWQGICKLPFIEESRLLAEITEVEHTLTDEERRRNSLGRDILYIHVSHALARVINSICEQMSSEHNLRQGKVEYKIDPKLSGGMNGFICISNKPYMHVDLSPSTVDTRTMENNGVISVSYKYPLYHPHIPRPPIDVRFPNMSVKKWDIRPLNSLWCANKRLGAARLLQPGRREFQKWPVTVACVETKGKARENQRRFKRPNENEVHVDHAAPTASVENKTKTGCTGRKVGSNTRGNSICESLPNSSEKKLEICVPEADSNDVGPHRLQTRSTNFVPNNCLEELKGSSEHPKYRDEKSEFCSLSSAEKLENCVSWEQNKGETGGTDLLQEIRTEGRTDKKKRKAERKKQKEMLCEEMQTQVLTRPNDFQNSSAENLKSAYVRPCDSNELEQQERGSENVARNELQEIMTVKPKKKKRKAKKSKEEEESNHIQGELKIQGQGKVKEGEMRKSEDDIRGSEVIRLLNNNDLQTGIACRSQCSGLPNDNAGLDKVAETGTEGKSRKRKRKAEKSNQSESALATLKTVGKQREENAYSAESNGTVSNGMEEINREKRSDTSGKKKKIKE